jgi:prepilin-type N-terminal cleavage/methylation domain-containing protein
VKHSSRGFTLVEVLVAVMITGIVAILAYQLFGAAADQNRRLHEARSELDRSSNGYRFLAAAFLSVDVALDRAGPFLGHEQRVQFPAWIPTSDGWLERQTVTLYLEGDRWIATASPEQTLELARGVTYLRFEYLLEPGSESKWVRGWESEVSAPLAVRIQVGRGEHADTMLYLVKARG